MPKCKVQQVVHFQIIVIVKEYGVISNSGQNIYYTAYYGVVLEDGDSAYFNLGSNYIAAVETTYDFRTHKITDRVVKVNKNNKADVQPIAFQDNVKTRIKGYNSVRNWVYI